MTIFRKLFDWTAQPVLLYAAVNWGLKDDYCYPPVCMKRISCVGQMTPNNMIYTDAARYLHLISSLIYPLTVRVFGVPQMILQPVSSIFPVLHCPLGPGELTIPLYPLYVYRFSTSRSPISPRGPAIKLIWTYDTDQVFFHCSFFVLRLQLIMFFFTWYGEMATEWTLACTLLLFHGQCLLYFVSFDGYARFLGVLSGSCFGFVSCSQVDFLFTW